MFEFMNLFFYNTGVLFWLVVWLVILWDIVSRSAVDKELTQEARDRIIELVTFQERSGLELQKILIEEGLMTKKSKGAFFYKTMFYLQQQGLVDYEDQDCQMRDLRLKQRFYTRKWI